MSERKCFRRSWFLAADVMVAIWNEDSWRSRSGWRRNLRAAGLRVDLYPEADKLGKQFKYASSLGVPFVAVSVKKSKRKGTGGAQRHANRRAASRARECVIEARGVTFAGKSAGLGNVMSSEAIVQNYFEDALKAMRAYKKLAEKAIAQLKDEEFFVTLDEEANSVAVIMKHMAGNMLSRWTDFLTSDGEKPIAIATWSL
jgi:histidyl-tRNA synthetase